MTKISTNAMAKRHLEALGYEVDITQHYIKYKGSPYGNRRDLFHCIDVVGIKPGIWLNVQACDSENISRAKKQAQQNSVLKTITQIEGVRFQIWEFFKNGRRWWIRRWYPRTADGHIIEWSAICATGTPSLDKEKEKERQKENRRKAKQTAGEKASISSLAGNDTPF